MSQIPSVPRIRSRAFCGVCRSFEAAQSSSEVESTCRKVVETKRLLTVCVFAAASSEAAVRTFLSVSLARKCYSHGSVCCACLYLLQSSARTNSPAGRSTACSLLRARLPRAAGSFRSALRRVCLRRSLFFALVVDAVFLKRSFSLPLPSTFLLLPCRLALAEYVGSY